MNVSSQAVFYEWLFQLNRCLREAAQIVEHFELEGLIHPEYARARRRDVDGLRADLSHVLTGLLNQRELEACVSARKGKLNGSAGVKAKP
jgi:hypothetical protein